MVNIKVKLGKEKLTEYIESKLESDYYFIDPTFYLDNNYRNNVEL